MRLFTKIQKGSMALALMAAIPFTSVAQDFETAGNGLRHTIVGNVKGKSVIYTSEIDGSVAQYSAEGKKMWRNVTDDPAVCFEIVAADITGDKNQDLLMASGNGHIYAWDSTGKLLWKFCPGTKVRLSEVAVVGSGKDAKIFAGGNNYKIYEIDATGKKLSETSVEGVVRKMESGNFFSKDKEDLFVFTLKHDKSGSEFFGFIDPITKKTISSSNIKNAYKVGMMIQDVSVGDVDKDGLDDIHFYGEGNAGTMFAMNGQYKAILVCKGNQKNRQRYSHGIGTSLLPVRDEVVVQFGGVTYIYDLQGKLISTVGAPHEAIIFNDMVVDPINKKLYCGGQVGGDNSIYVYDLTKKNWYNEKHEFIGRHAEVNDNLNEMYAQTLKFELPSYQTKKEEPFIVLGGRPTEEFNKETAHLKGGNFKFVNETAWAEDYDRSFMQEKLGEWTHKRDKRREYDKSQADFIAFAKEQEKLNAPFTIWAGHGSDPLMLSIETLVKIIEVAPTACQGYVYAEMGNTHDPRVEYFVREVVPTLAKVIRENNSPAKLYFRYKNMFWAADCHHELWRELFFSKKYADILVPAAEDTNNRVQDYNFTGRVGMFASGYVDNFAMRLVDDNPTSWRPLSPGGQRSPSPYVRNGAIMAAYGSRYAVLFPIKYFEGTKGYYYLFALMKAGVIPVVHREDILSIGSWVLMDDMNVEYLENSINNGHDLTKYDTIDNDQVFANAGVHWCGASVQKYDYSKMLGVDYRWLNFIPAMPNGMIPITDADYEPQLKKEGASYVSTDITYGYKDGKKYSGKEFGPVMEAEVKEGASKMLMKVEGASWSLIRIDKNHARLVLVDQGYVDPQERDVTITFQTKTPIGGVDILSKEKVSTKGKKSINVKVPAGAMRFIDFEYSDEI